MDGLGKCENTHEYVFMQIYIFRENMNFDTHRQFNDGVFLI